MADSVIVDKIIKYNKDLHVKVQESNSTAQWDISNDTHAQLSISDFETESPEISSGVFSPAVVHTTAHTMALSSAYDITQACTRLSMVFRKTRADYYKEADDAMKILESRNAIQTQMLAAVAGVSGTVQEALSTK